MIPGEYFLRDLPIECNVGRDSLELVALNLGDRPIQVGSHFHFYEVNDALSFDRSLAKGMRLDIPSGNAVRFEPGEPKTVRLVALGGAREVYGFSNRVDGPLAP